MVTLEKLLLQTKEIMVVKPVLNCWILPKKTEVFSKVRLSIWVVAVLSKPIKNKF